MAMKELMRVQLNARQIAEILAKVIATRSALDREEAVAIDVPADLIVTIVIRNRRQPRKDRPKRSLAVASAGPLSEAEQRYA